VKKLKVFIDSDIILDLLLEREGFYEYAALIFENSEKGNIYVFTSSISIANISYIIRKEIKNSKKVKEYIKNLIEFIHILSVEESTIQEALETDFLDFEDSIQYITAVQNQMDYILTRNKKDYKTSSIKVYDSKEFYEKIIHK
jgi:predicted nucleic acid-binding protein